MPLRRFWSRFREGMAEVAGEPRGYELGNSTASNAIPAGREQTDEQVLARLRALEVRMQALEQRVGGRQRGIWVERVMYWVIVVGLIVAIILLA